MLAEPADTQVAGEFLRRSGVSWVDWRLVVAAFLVNLWALMAMYRLLQANSPPARYLDLAASWWKINWTYRSEATWVQAFLPIKLLEDQDLTVLFAGLVAAFSSPTVRGYSRAIVNGRLAIAN